MLVAVLAGDREHAPLEVLQRRGRQILAHHDGGPVAVAEVRDPHPDALLAQLHRERRNHERRVEPPALHRLDHGREIGEALRLEARGAAGLRREVGDRARQMAGDGQEPDGERLALAAGGLPGGRHRRALPRLQPQHGEDGDEGQGARAPAYERRRHRDSWLLSRLSFNDRGRHRSARAAPGSTPIRARARSESDAPRSRPRDASDPAAAAIPSTTSSRTRAGRSDSTSTRSASCAASSISWVTRTTVRGCSRRIRASSRRILRRVR